MDERQAAEYVPDANTLLVPTSYSQTRAEFFYQHCDNADDDDSQDDASEDDNDDYLLHYPRNGAPHTP